MPYILSLLKILPFAALTGLLAYMPVYFVIRRRIPNMYWLRHMINLAFVTYLVSMFWIVFLWQPALTNTHYFNLMPFRETLYYTYTYGNRLAESQYMLNMIMFLPFGLMLPLVFPKRINRFYLVALISLAATALIEGIQYAIGRVGDVDDMIANLMGGAAGFCLYSLLRHALRRRKWFRKACLVRRTYGRFGTAVLTVVMILILCFPMIMDISFDLSEFGLVASMRLPDGTEIMARLNDEPVKTMTYKQKACDREAMVRSIMDALEIKGVPVYNKEDGTYEVSDNSGALILTQQCAWTYKRSSVYDYSSQINSEGKMPSDEQYIETAELVVNPLLDELESIDRVRMETNRYDKDGNNMIMGKSVVFTLNNLEEKTVTFGEIIVRMDIAMNIVEIDSKARRYEEYREIEIMPTLDAVRHARNYGYRIEFRDAAITNIELSYLHNAAKAQLLPAYKVTIEAYSEATGKKNIWESYIAAMR